MQKTQYSHIKVLIYIAFALLFSIGVRLVWVYQFHDDVSSLWNGQIMINTNDGYYFAEGARDVLAGFHQENDLSPINSALSLITAFLAKISPFSFESILLFMPTFFGSLLVVPMVLIGKEVKNVEMGFIAALLASIAWSYYNRTMSGYYDTDMLNIVFPTFTLWTLLLSFRTQKLRYAFWTGFILVVYNWWYGSAYSLEFAFFGLVFAYILVFDRKNEQLYKLLIFMLLPLLGVWILVKLAILIVVFMILRQKLSIRAILALFALEIVAFFLTGGFDPIWGKLKGYVFRDAVLQTQGGYDLHFFSVMQTIKEAGKIPFELFANRISGNVATFFVSFVGYVWLCYRHRVMLLSLPMLGLGFLAYNGGLRFTIYAVPLLALGVAYLLVKLSEFTQNRVLKYTFLALLTGAILYPNITHVVDYKVPTVFNAQEVSSLDRLKNSSSREDYVISWWDYGYPLRYYADVKTLADGGKHSGSVNFAPSYILTHPQKEAANMARLDVEFTELSYDENRSDANLSNVGKMMKHYGYKDPNAFLSSLSDDIVLPKKTRDVFLYLPYRMLGIYPTISQFSNIDLTTGKIEYMPYLRSFTRFKDTPQALIFSDQMYLDKASNSVVMGKNSYKINTFTITGYDKLGTFRKKVMPIDMMGRFYVIFSQTYRLYIIMDQDTYNSTYIQLFFLENYDKDLFEPIASNPYSKIYKLKR